MKRKNKSEDRYIQGFMCALTILTEQGRYINKNAQEAYCSIGRCNVDELLSFGVDPYDIVTAEKIIETLS